MNNPTITASSNQGVTLGSTLSFDELNRQREALDEQRRQLDEQEATLRRQAEEAARAKITNLPAYLGVDDLNAVLALIRSVQRGTVTKSGRRDHGRIPEDVKEAIAKALKAGCSVPDVCKYWHVSSPWVALYKKKLKLVGKSIGRRSLKEVMPELKAA